jgi:serine/threonine protein kinase/thioredoxin-like negative regulator of GroEL
MAIPLASGVVAVCSICGEPLNAKGDCLACLLRTGLDESVVETKPLASLVFGDFEVAQRPDGFYWELGHGGMGVTYLAVDNVLRRRVALKVIELPAAARSSQAVRERFLREARAAAALRHPNVAAVFQFGASPDGRHCYYAMELVEGGTLEARVRKDGPLKAETTLEIAIQITRALMAAAAHGLIHRDLKPGNILLTAGSAATTELEVKVIDFGLAKAIADAGGDMDLTHGEFVGTPNFASPEQLGSGPVDARSDIYSLGATLWFALTGLVPSSGKTIEEIRARQTRGDLPVEQLVVRKVPEPVVKLLRSTLAVDPSKRPASARELMGVLDSCRRKLAPRMGVFYKLTALIAVVAVVVATLFLFRLSRQRMTAASAKNVAAPTAAVKPLPEKSIAVLPLENLSDEKENAFFADGIQDELLSNLSKIADLKVISRTSVMQYKSGVKHNLKEIAQQLGVGNVVEGSVRRSGDRVRVWVQLIDARTDRQVWGRTYDRTLADSLALQGDLATEITTAVGATLSSQEKARIKVKPTNNPAAYDAYLRARALPRVWASRLHGDLNGAIRLYHEAVNLDPNFGLAWAYLSIAHSHSYLLGFDSSPARLRAARDSLDRALALDPNLPEVHLALGYYRHDEGDRTGALGEFRQAEQGLPNSADVIEAIALAQKTLGNWDESIAELRRAIELDPRNVTASNNLGLTYLDVRRFPEALATLDRVLAWEPTNARALLTKAEAFLAMGDLQAAEPLLAKPDVPATWRAHYARLQRRYASAAELLSQALDVEGDPEAIVFLAEAQQLAGDVSAARATYQKAVQDLQRQLEGVARGSFEEARRHGLLGLAYAGLGEAASAIAEGQKAMTIRPISKDAWGGPVSEVRMAEIYAKLGDADHAIPILQRVLHLPCGSGITTALLRLDPIWDPIRNDPRFQELASEKAP